MKDIGKGLRGLRKRRGMSQERFAAAAGLGGGSTVSCAERGARRPTAAELLTMLHALYTGFEDFSLQFERKRLRN